MLKNMGITRKKQCVYAEASAEERARFDAHIKRIPPEKRVFMDESGVGEHPQRKFGRAPRGEAVIGTKPGKRPSQINVIVALCVAAHLCVECYRHATTAEFFERWFETQLLEAIPRGEGYTVILDNASFHRKKALRKLARGKVRLLFLPPYSPDYNRIEKTWANMKRFLRGNLDRCVSVEFAVFAYFAFSRI